MDIYKRIDALIAAEDIERKVLCERAGIKYSTFTSMINRKSKNVCLDTIKKIADYFNISTDYLLSSGVFENWDEIISNWQVVADYINAAFIVFKTPFLTHQELMDSNLLARIRIIYAIFSKIEFDYAGSEKAEAKFRFNEYSYLELNKKEKQIANISNKIENTTEKNYYFTLSEQNIIKKYRAVDEHSKKTIELIIDNEYSRVKEDAKLNVEFDKELEQKRLNDYYEKANLQINAKYNSIDSKKISVPPVSIKKTP